MGTNCAPLVADLFLFCYERDFMKSLAPENQADIIEAFNSTSRYLDDLLNLDNIYFEQIVNRIYPAELQLNKANSSDTEAPFLELNLSISNGTVSTTIYDNRDDFDFDIVDFSFLDEDVPRRTSYGVYISQLIRFARVSSNVSDFNCRNKALTAKLLKQGYHYHKLRKAFSKFYRRHSELVEKYNVSLWKLLQQGISEPGCNGYLVCRIRKNVEKSNFSEQFRKLINRYKRIGYNPYVMRQTACLVINPTSVDSYALLFNCTTAGRASDSIPRHKAFTSGLGLDVMSLAWPTVVQLVVSFNSGLQWGISQEYSFFVSSQWSIWVCVFAEIHWLSEEAIMRTELFMYFFVLRIISGPRVKFVQWKAFKPPGSVYYWPF